MLLQDLWTALSERKWQSYHVLGRITGLDKDSLNYAINFLVRWNFAESRRFPELCIRRKPGAVSPPEMVALLHTLTRGGRAKTSFGQVDILAERVACRNCGGHEFIRLKGNKVECTRCAEQQWFAIKRSGCNI
jgi:hypothetical protein